MEEALKQDEEVLRRRREVVSELAGYVERGLRIVLGIEGLKVLAVEPLALAQFTEYMEEYALLPRDAFHVASMALAGCRDIASADSDFDAVLTISSWSPLS